MADFLVAYTKLGPKEGGYVNNPSDTGKETWKGISRVHHPRWSGWILIDEAKNNPHFPDVLDNLPALEDAVKSLYREEYWNRIRGDDIPQQDIADELFEAGVNCHPSNAVRFVQTAVNVLNRNQKLYLDIDVDGTMGRNTLGAIQDCIKSRSVRLLLKIMNQAQGNYYMDLLIRKPDQEVFAVSWFSRVEL